MGKRNDIKKLNVINMRVGSAVIRIEGADKNRSFGIEEDYLRFLTDDKKHDVNLTVYHKKRPYFDLSNRIFDSTTTWNLYEDGNRYLLRVGHSGEGSFVEQTSAILDSDFKRGEIYVGEWDENVVLYPWNFPLDELFTINYLSMYDGALIHACGVDLNGRGFLCAGVSGAGKSTMSKLWIKHRNAPVLSDDRIIIQKINDEFYGYGTPWHGDANICLAQSAPIKRVFFIRHGKENRIRKLKESEALSTLIARTFAPYWKSEMMERTVSMYHDLINSVESYELSFVPDESVVEFIEKL